MRRNNSKWPVRARACPRAKMRTPRTLSLLAAIVVVAHAGCLRSLPELPAPPEGLVVVGAVVRASGEPIVGARLQHLGGQDAVRTGEGGRFRFERLPLGVTLRLAVRAADRGGTLVHVLEPLQPVIDAQVIDLGTIRVGAPGALSGLVMRQDGATRVPAAGAACFLDPDERSALVDARGLFRLDTVPAGAHDVTCVAPGFAAARHTGVRVSDGAEVRVPELVLVPDDGATGELTGAVALADRPSSSGVRLSLLTSTGDSRGLTVTDGRGRFTFSAPSGVYRVVAEYSGYQPARSLTVVVVPRDTTSVGTLVLRPATSGDLDGDGVADTADDDRDGDLCPDAEDVRPDDPWACLDTDRDGLPDVTDDDRDGDGLSNAEEDSAGLDGWTTDPDRADTDDDGTPDPGDLCPATADPAQRDTDGDGRGDACDTDPQLDTFAPLSGGPGTTVIVTGLNLASDDQLTLVELAGVVALAREVTPTRLVFTVPAGASTSRLSVRTRVGRGTTTQDFVVTQGPTVFEVRPAWATVGAAVEVMGTGFDTRGLRVSVGAVEARTSSVVSLPGGRQRLRVRFDSPTSGPVRVETAEGASSSSALLVVVPVPQVDGLEPSAAAPGDRISLVGRGLATTAIGAAVVVRFTGGAEATASSDDPARLVVEVPAGAQSGPLELRHPTGTLATAVLTVLPRVTMPSIAGLDRAAVVPGDTLRIYGQGLNRATRVTFAGDGGRRTATLLGSSDTWVDVTVPLELRAGPVEVEVMGSATLVGPRVVVARRGAFYAEPRLLRGDTAGFGFGPLGAELFVVDVRGRANLSQLTVTVLDGSSLVPVRSAVLTIPEAAVPVAGFQVSPSGQRALLWSSTGQTWVIDLPGLSIRALCSDAPTPSLGRGTGTWAFDSSETAAYAVGATDAQAGTDGVLRVRLADGACGRVVTEPGVASLLAVVVVPGVRDELIVSHSSRGLGRFVAETGAVVSPYAPPLSAHTTLALDGDGRRVWGHAGAPSSRYDGAASPLVSSDALYADSRVATSRGGRWVFGTGATSSGVPGGLLIDTTSLTPAAPVMPLARTAYGVVAHPSAASFVAADLRGGLVRLDVEE